MKAIGGFFELEPELGSSGAGPHPRAHALSTGRACLMVMLSHLSPRHVWVPFYTCDAALAPFKELAIPSTPYALDENMLPLVPSVLGPGELLLWTDYFGVCSAQRQLLKRTYGSRLLIDDTHSFFHGGAPDEWSFTSARKYFGVPDGAYLYSPVDLVVDAQRFAKPSLTHGALRALGEREAGFAAYQEYERSLDCAIRRISAVSELLLRRISYHDVMARRRENFDFLHRRLGRANRFPLAEVIGEVPFCYPYLPDRAVARAELHAEEIFVPSYWLDVIERRQHGYAWECHLSANLLPLPIDHRYTPSDLCRVADFLGDRL